jgi:hypothetical protein
MQPDDTTVNATPHTSSPAYHSGVKILDCEQRALLVQSTPTRYSFAPAASSSEYVMHTHTHTHTHTHLHYFARHQVHPDKNSTQRAEAAFRTVQAAYDQLSDPTTRKRFDQSGVANNPEGKNIRVPTWEEVLEECFNDTSVVKKKPQMADPWYWGYVCDTRSLL